MNKSPTASVNENSEDEYALMVTPILPEESGKTAEADVGVKLRPLPSAPMEDDSVHITVELPTLGRICNLP
jgi:hypothetical protein